MGDKSLMTMLFSRSNYLSNLGIVTVTSCAKLLQIHSTQNILTIFLFSIKLAVPWWSCFSTNQINCGMAAILVTWSLTFVINLIPSTWSLHMKFRFKLPSGFWETYVLIYWWDSNISDFGWKAKGQPWPLELIYSHYLIRFNIQLRIMNLASTVLKLKLFKKNPISYPLGSKFDLDVK